MLWLHVAFLSLLVCSEAFFSWLSVLNVRHGRAAIDRNREWFDERLDIEDIEKLLGYQRAKTGASQVETWVGLALLLVVLYSGLLADAVAAVETLGLETVPSGVVFFAGIVVALRISSIPFDLFDTFVVEELFGFNEQSPRLWVRDFAVGLAVSLAFTALLGGAVMAVIVALPDLWWIAAWALFLAFSLAMLVIYPRVIAPLFNDFEPIESGTLHEGVMEVFDRAGFSCSQIYSMDASRRSSHSNAYFIGFGRTKRVVLFDTLIEQLELDELQSVLAHELAHWKNAHIWKQIAASAVQMGLVFFVVYHLATGPWLYDLFGLASGPAKPIYAGLFLAGLVVYPINRLTRPIENKLSLAHEREADAFAVEVMGEGDSMIDALCRLTSENLSNPFPHPLYELFHYSHPPIPDRIRAIQDLSDDAAADSPDSESRGGGVTGAD